LLAVVPERIPSRKRLFARATRVLASRANGTTRAAMPTARAAGTFEPQIVRERQRRLTGVDEMVLSLYAKGLKTGEIRDFRALRGDLRGLGKQGKR